MAVSTPHRAAALLLWVLAVCGQVACENITCTQSGYVCSTDCKMVYQCLGTEPNFNLVTLERCDKTKHYYCSLSLGKCSSTFASTCPPPGYKFECTSIGIFPDPYDCALFHMCHSGSGAIVDSEERCESGWLYSVEHHSCRIEANSCMEDPVPPCRTTAQRGQLKNAAYYYECTASEGGLYLYPTLYQCAHGGVYSDTQNKCVDNSTLTIA